MSFTPCEMTLVDLFCGAGGFSLGAHRAGFRVATAYDNDPILTSSFNHNFPMTELVLKDISQLTGAELCQRAGGHVDGIFGGPPCQGFSEIGKRMPGDPRRELLRHFFRLVAEVKPKFFVMENVRGLAFSEARGVLDEALSLVETDYWIAGPTILDASEFGAATKRLRLFVIGIRKGRGELMPFKDIAIKKRPAATVRAAISDLKDAVSIGDRDGFDVWRIGRLGRPFPYAKHMRAHNRLFTGQRVPNHTQDVIKRFQLVEQGCVDAIGRHPRLDWDGQCPTLRAGTGTDRGSFQSVRPIHPDLPRVITVREAARLQGFPDEHRFHPTMWHSFRMIGNSVSPIIAEAIFTAIKERFSLGRPVAVAAE